MPVKINVHKPEFNLREKLNRLDTERVPYERMPAGSVIQTQFTRFDYVGTSNEFETTSSSFQATHFLVKISPKFANSLIRFDASVNIKQNTGGSYLRLALFKDIDGGGFSHFTGGTTGHGLITYRITGATTAWDHTNFVCYDRPQTVKPITYKLYLSNSDNSQNVRVGENGATEFVSAMEIRQ